MKRRRREFSIFTLSFLDIMSCGFGAVVLLFLITKHAVVPPAADASATTQAIDHLTSAIEQARTRNAALRARIDAQGTAVVVAEARAQAASARLAAAPTPAADDEARVKALRETVARLEADKRTLLERDPARAHYVRGFVGPGNREYLTGLQLGGHRVLVLLDTSSSMLDESIALVLRRRNQDVEAQRQAPKWRQAIATVDWITAHFARAARFQIYTYDTEAHPVLPGTDGTWQDVGDAVLLDDAVQRLRQRVPAGGSSLERALMVIEQMKPAPDNVFLITDGLPTQGLTPPAGATVSGETRLKLFEAAVRHVAPSIPINIVLLPMEGDPMAAFAYWQLALATQGAFLSPSADWP